MYRDIIRNTLVIRVFAVLCLVFGLSIIAAPYVFAQISTTQEQQVVGDFATFIINILTGPVSKILGAILLIG